MTTYAAESGEVIGKEAVMHDEACVKVDMLTRALDERRKIDYYLSVLGH